MTQDKARALMARVDAALLKMKDDTDLEPVAINWGDISSRDVIEERSVLDGISIFYVHVEEASPEAAYSIWNYMGRPDDLNIRTEW